MALDRGPTAFSVGLQRAVHALLDPEPLILEDAASWHLLEQAERDFVEQRSELFKTAPVRSFRQRLLTRQRFAEDALGRAVHDSAGPADWQYVILGAGMDSFAWRQPSWGRSLAIFEVDRPHEQALKRERVGLAGLGIPSNLTFVEADFEQDDVLDRLVAAGLSLEVPTFFACLGVVVYLSHGAVERLLGMPLKMKGPTQIAVSTAGDINQGSERVLAHMAASNSEAWISPVGPEAMRDWLQRLGYAHAVVTDTNRYLVDIMSETSEQSTQRGGGSPSHLFLATK